MAKSKQIPRPLVLMILDGYGISFLAEGNAVMAARQPVLSALMREYPLAAIKAAGIAVGLPWGEMGNSETGHQNIGSGRIVYQYLPRISLAIEDESFYSNPILLRAIEKVKKDPNAALHTIGLLSNGGVHSHIDHQIALLKLAAMHGIGKRTFLHIFLDGRDSPPDSAGNFVNQIERVTKHLKAGRISTMIGRYYGMDRDNNWERTEGAYRLLVEGEGLEFDGWQTAIEAAYVNTDTKSFENAKAMKILKKGEQPRLIKDGDAVVFYNYRSDRAKQLTAAFTKPGFNEFAVRDMPNLNFVTMAEFEDNTKAQVAFPKQKIDYPLGRVVSEAKMKQLRIAEGEKFAHVTRFFNGGLDEPFPNEERVEIPSLKVKGFDTAPGMSAAQISDRVIMEIINDRFDLIVMNYANPDMVAHTGNLAATVEALELMDKEIGRVVEAVLAAGGAILLTCDHGNAETVVHQLTHQRSTDHTNNPVPLIYIAPDNKQHPSKSDETVRQILSMPIGVLADVAPTTLDILNLTAPAQMTTQSLLPSLL